MLHPLPIALALLAVLAPQAISAEAPYSSYLELRVYRAQDGQRDRFLDYFEEHYLESQEDAGMRIWGQFRDLDAPDLFVWMRGYRTMEARPAALWAFYAGPVWAETSAPVGEMLADASHVHFLEPVSPAHALDDRLERDDSNGADTGVVVAQVFLAEGAVDPLVDRVRAKLPRFADLGAVSLGLFRSSDEPNNFPQLKFIEDELVVVWFASFASVGAYEKAVAAEAVGPTPFETFVLEPGARSRLRHRAR